VSDGEVLREWTEKITLNEAVIREQQLELVIRPKPRWLPRRVWKWAIGKLLFIVELRVNRPKTKELRIENAELRELVSNEWFSNHYEHCGEWPHPNRECRYPMPETLRKTIP
jgi:hypothetical protein